MDSWTINAFISVTVGSFIVFPSSSQTFPLHFSFFPEEKNKILQTWKIKVINNIREKNYLTLFHIFTYCIIRIKWKVNFRFCWTYIMPVVMTFFLNWTILRFGYFLFSGNNLWRFYNSIQLSRWKWSPQFTSLPKRIWLLLFLINQTR